MSLRDKVLAKPVAEDTVEIDGDSFLIVGKRKRERAAIFAKARRKDQSLDFERLEDVLLAECVCDPATKTPLLSAAEWSGVDSSLTGPLMSVVMQVCGMDKTDISPKGSDSTET